MSPEFKAQLQRQETACLRFLGQHHQYGGVTEEECRKLRVIILTISSIGRGIHKGDLHYTRWYSRSIRRALGVVRSGLMGWVDKSCEVGFAVLKLRKEGCDGNQTVAERWEDLLETLQDPTDNDTVFYTMLLEHFDRLVFKPLLAIRYYEHLRDPFDAEVYPELAAVYDALDSVRDCAKHCDELVEMLHQNLEEYKKWLARDRRSRTPEEWEAHVWPETPETPKRISSNQDIPSLTLPSPADAVQIGQLQSSSDTPAPAEDTQAQQAPKANPPMTILPHGLSKSFSAAEEAVSRHGEHTESEYIARPIKKSGSWSSSPKVGHRRKGASVPRVFTGSMQRLERAVERLDLLKANTSEEETVPPLPTHDGGSIRVKDFADSPRDMSAPPPAPNMDLSPLKPCQEEEDNTEGSRRDITARLLSSNPRRLKSSKSASSSLEAWLTDASLARKTYGLSPVKRSQMRHRENTI